jgi:hypothetical protein
MVKNTTAFAAGSGGGEPTGMGTAIVGGDRKDI